MTPAPQASRTLRNSIAAATVAAALVIGYAAPALADEAVDAAPTTPDQIDTFEISETRIESDALSEELAPSTEPPAPVEEISTEEAPSQEAVPNEGDVPAADGATAGPSPITSQALPPTVTGQAAPKYPASGGTKRFIDVPKGHTFYAPITWMYQTGLTTGIETPSGTAYKPESSLTRGAMAAFLYRQAGRPSYTPVKRFVDVPQGHTFSDAIGWMRATGLSVGVETKQGVQYKPSSSLNRGAMAAFLYRQAGAPSFTNAAAFPDVARSHTFYKPISWMRATGLTVGVETDQGVIYKPAGSVTRGAMAAFMYREAGRPQFIDSGTVAITTSGGARVGEPATAKMAGWEPSTVEFTYQWLRNQIPIPGATTVSYTPDAADQGKHLQVQVTAALQGAKPVTMTSASTQVGAKKVTVQEIEDQIFALVNQERTSRGLHALEKSHLYQTRAREWTQHLVDGGSGIGAGNMHSPPEWWDGSTTRNTGAPWYDDMSFVNISENIAIVGSSDLSAADRAVASWMSSRGHCNWLMSDQLASGVGAFAKHSPDPMLGYQPGDDAGGIASFVMSTWRDADQYGDPEPFVPGTLPWQSPYCP